MAQVQNNGSALTSTPYGTFTQVRNNDGTIRANGTIVSNIIGSTKTSTTPVSSFNSTVVNNGWVDPAVNAGTFRYDNTKPISSLITKILAGLSNTQILTPGDDGDTVRSINKFETNRSELFTTALRSNKYNRTTDTWDAGYPSGVVISFSTDKAATPTRANPGRLTFLRGSTIPYTDSYKPETNWKRFNIKTKPSLLLI